MDRRHKIYNNRKEWMQGEFDFSDEEIDGLDKFLSGREGGLVSEFLRSVINTEDLNNRQKVIVSFMMGRFVQENVQGQMRSIERSMVDAHNQPTEFGG